MNVHLDMQALAREAKGLDAICGGDEQLFHDMLLGESDIDSIILRIHEQVARDDEMLTGIVDRQRSLAERKKRIEARRNGAKALIGKVLRIARLNKLELPEVTYSVRDGKPTLKVVDPAAVPESLSVCLWSPDKRAINDAYGDAADLPNWLVREPASDVVMGRVK